MPRRNLTPTEHAEQSSVFDWAAWMTGQYPELNLLYACPNGGHRHPAVAAKLKKEGVRSGVPDIFLPVSRGGAHGLYIELKRERGGHLSDAQEWWLAHLEEQGYAVAVCKGAAEAIETISNYLDGKAVRYVELYDDGKLPQWDNMWYGSTVTTGEEPFLYTTPALAVQHVRQRGADTARLRK